jgi:hypothetical protein
VRARRTGVDRQALHAAQMVVPPALTPIPAATSATRPHPGIAWNHRVLRREAAPGGTAAVAAVPVDVS